MSQFPAAALVYRKGYLRRGEPVVHDERALDDLWQRRVPLIAGANRSTRDTLQPWEAR